MKKEYSAPEMEAIELEKDDTILTSGACVCDLVKDCTVFGSCTCHGHAGEEK